MLRPVIVGMRGSMVIPLRPCMRSSASLLSSTTPPPSSTGMYMGVNSLGPLVENVGDNKATISAPHCKVGGLYTLVSKFCHARQEDVRRHGCNTILSTRTYAIRRRSIVPQLSLRWPLSRRPNEVRLECLKMLGVTWCTYLLERHVSTSLLARGTIADRTK